VRTSISWHPFSSSELLSTTCIRLLQHNTSSTTSPQVEQDIIPEEAYFRSSTTARSSPPQSQTIYQSDKLLISILARQLQHKMRRRIVPPPAIGDHNKLLTEAGSALLPGEETESSSTTTKSEPMVPQQEPPSKRRKRESGQDQDALSLASISAAAVGPSMLAETIVPPRAVALRYDARRRSRRDLPAAQHHQGYHQPAASNEVLHESLAPQALVDSLRRRLTVTNSNSTIPSTIQSTGISDSLHYRQSSPLSGLHSSLLYSDLRGTPHSLLAPPNTLRSAAGTSGNLLASTPQYPGPSVNTDPRLSQLLLSGLLQRDLLHQALLYQFSLLGGEVDPSRSTSAAYGTQPPGGVGAGILQDQILGLQQERLGSLGARVPTMRLPPTAATSGLLQPNFANPYLAPPHIQPDNDTSAHPLLAAAQRRSALLVAGGYPQLLPARLSQQGGTSIDSLALDTSSLQQRANSSNADRLFTARAGGGPEAFPMILHRALADLQLAEGGSELATFLPDGKYFVIQNQFLFQELVLPVFFPRMTSFASFQRQLNLYDFKRVGGTGVDRGAYHHDLFVRGNPDDASRMKRIKIKGGTPRGSPRVQDRLPSEEVPAGSDDGDEEEEEKGTPPDQPAEGKSEE
jgi:hypothetical protein